MFGAGIGFHIRPEVTEGNRIGSGCSVAGGLTGGAAL